MLRANSVDNLSIKEEENDDLAKLRRTNSFLLERIKKLEDERNAEQTNDYVEENVEYDEVGDYEDSRKGSSSAASQRLEALKILRTLIPHDLNDQFVDQFVLQSFRSIRSYFPKLRDPDIIELITHRLPKRLSSSYGALRSCRTQKEFTKELCFLVYESGRGDQISTITSFLKFKPKNLQKLGFRELVLAIVSNAQTLILFDALTDVTKTKLILDKLYVYIPYSVVKEIKSKIDLESLHTSSIVETLKTFFNDSLIDREVRMFLRSYKSNQDSKEVKQMKASETEKPNKESQVKKDQGRSPRPLCYRCGSGLHASSDCYVYKNKVSEHCTHCLKNEKIKLYHESRLCKLSK